MSNDRRDLRWLVAPLAIEEFLEERWQRQPIHLTGRDPAAEWFNSRQLEELIEIAQPKPPSIRLVAQGRAALAVPELRVGRLDTTSIRLAFLDGYTIVVNNVQRYHPRLQELVQTLQEQMSFPVEANCYFTPPGAKGFHPHYDSHDVFAVQIEGTKQWKVYGQEAARDLNELVDGDPFDRGELPCAENIQMEPGDVLYIPRGWVHEAETADDSASLHVTLGVHVQTGRDLFRAMVDAMCRDDPAFLRPLPFGFLRNEADPARLHNVFVELHRRLGETAPIGRARAFLQDEHIRRTVPVGAIGLADLDSRLTDIASDSLLERCPYVPARVARGDGGVVVQFLSRAVELPQRFGAAIDFILSHDGAFRLACLPELADCDRRELVARLVSDGLLRCATE